MPSPAAEAGTAAFERERPRLTNLAYRMLGSRAEAEDAVQEAWLRYASTLAGPDPIRDPAAWLTTTVGRICLDVLRSARVRREAYPGQWLPEPVVTRLPESTDPAGGFAPDPAAHAERTAEVSLALLVVLERLTPEQRVAFVLHDAFGMPFEQIATVLGGTAAAARQLATRARRAVAAGGARHTAGLAEQRRVLDAFLTASRTGDLAALLAVLAPEATFVGDGGGAAAAVRQPVVGAVQVARFVAGLVRRLARDTRDLRMEPVLVNGSLGLLVHGRQLDGRTLTAVLGLAIADGRITALYNQLNPAKLGRVPLSPPR